MRTTNSSFLKDNLPQNIHFLIFVAIIVRAITVFLKNPGFPEHWGGEMTAVANSIANGMGFASPYLIDTGATALVPPVYPYILACIFSLFGYSLTSGIIAYAINIIFSSLVSIPVFLIARKLFNQNFATVVAWLWALYPILGYTEALYIWNTSLYTLLLTSYLAFTLSLEKKSNTRKWFLYGGLTGLLIITEPVSLTVIGVSILYLIKERMELKPVAIALLVASVLPVAWTVRNFIVFGEPVFLRSGFALELSRGIRDNELEGQVANSLPNRNPCRARALQANGRNSLYADAKT